MQLNRIGMKISIFCMTFLLGLSLPSQFDSDTNNHSNKITQKNIKSPTVSFNQQQIRRKSVKPQCKKYFDFGKYNDLIKEQGKTKGLLVIEKNPRKQKAQRQKIEELENQIKSLKQFRNDLRITSRESDATHNLIYIENCAEY